MTTVSCELAPQKKRHYSVVWHLSPQSVWYCTAACENIHTRSIEDNEHLSESRGDAVDN